MPKVSIIIPVYNVERYLRECLDSVVNQTLKDIEIICVNDGSTDSSLDILNEYALSDERIRVLNKQNGGYGKAMNFGLERATGEYIGIVEPDDYIDLNMYELLYEKAKKYNSDIVKSDFYALKTVKGVKRLNLVKLDKSGLNYERMINPQINTEPYKFNKYTWCGIYKRSLIVDNNFRYNETPGASYQDNGFFFLTLCFAKNIYFIEKPLYMYRCDNPSASVKNKKKVYIMQDEYSYILNELKKRNLNNERIIKLYNFEKYRSYIFNFNRIADCFKRDFLKVFSQEFSLSEKNNELDYSLFDKKNKDNLKLIINNPDKFLRDFKVRKIMRNIFSINRDDTYITYIILFLRIKRKIKNENTF